MNYFEIVNKVLLELNYRPLEDFGRIYKSEHKKILDAINRVNREVLGAFNWPFLERQELLNIPAGQNHCELPFCGDIKAVYDGKKRLKYTLDALKHIDNADLEDSYALIPACGDKKAQLILPKANQDKDYTVIYYSNDAAVDENGAFKAELTGKNDISIIPMPYAEQLLVYGTCLKIKANPSYPKFGFWNTLYIQALANLRQKSPQTKECEPFISIA